MKNNVLQNSGEENQFFYIDFSKKADTVTTTFTLEGSESNLVKLTARDKKPLPGGSLLMEFKSKPEIWLLDTVSLENNDANVAADAVHVFLAGDSTVKDYGSSNTIGGWGEFIGNYFTDDVLIVNKAEGGRSTRSFLNQGRLDEILSQAEEGDYLFIQFGHNDSLTTDTAQMEHSVSLGVADENGIYPSSVASKVKTPQRIIDFYANDNYPYGEMFYPYDSGTFKWYLEQYVIRAREHGMIPVVITPVCRVFFDGDGKITPHFGEDNGYVEAVRQVANEMDCPLIDMYNITSSLYESYGVLTTQGLHNVKSDGSMDLTHYNKFGANLIASKMAQSLADQNIAFAKNAKNSNVSVNRVDEMKSATLFVIGDVCADKNDKDNLISSASYGDKLSEYFVDKITVKDLTVTDCTAKSFANSKEYTQFMNQVKEGDYVLINFGRLDYDKSTTDNLLDRYSDVKGDINTKGSFKYCMYNSYIKPLMDKKAVPIIVTPMVDGKFNGSEAVNNIVEYSQALKDLVVEYSLYFVDMNTQSAELYTAMGKDGSKVLNAIDSKKGIERNRLSDFGADTIARKFVSSMKYSSATLKNYINETKLSNADILTKAEFVTAIVNVMKLDKKADTNFKDIVKGKNYYDSILVAKYYGIAKGDLKNNFKPESQLYGSVCIQMLNKALVAKGIDNSELSDVYKLIENDKPVTNEIGLYAVVRLYESLNHK